ncbi:hypothetical protein CFBP6411_03124 [Pseudomonas syringae group genomosp. 3]|uniref:Uncharacterized protein n=1 Tax=Pseudomonas syringae group genomosp. 3 TaxID=251701 RepID=A0A2K4WF30_9PSED|nr:hypothetical protein CFBP6411_03124 [Pseudomonas syringae group genomosp. 3]
MARIRYNTLDATDLLITINGGFAQFVGDRTGAVCVVSNLSEAYSIAVVAADRSPLLVVGPRCKPDPALVCDASEQTSISGVFVMVMLARCHSILNTLYLNQMKIGIVFIVDDYPLRTETQRLMSCVLRKRQYLTI